MVRPLGAGQLVLVLVPVLVLALVPVLVPVPVPVPVPVLVVLVLVLDVIGEANAHALVRLSALVDNNANDAVGKGGHEEPTGVDPKLAFQLRTFYRRWLLNGLVMLLPLRMAPPVQQPKAQPHNAAHLACPGSTTTRPGAATSPSVLTSMVVARCWQLRWLHDEPKRPTHDW